MNNASYVLFAYSSFKFLSLEQLLKIGMNQNEDPNPIPSFDENLLINLCKDATEIFSNENTVLEIDGDTIIVGDIHGSFHDLLRILHYHHSSDAKIVFLGDYVDRGSFSLECITLLLALKITYPDKFYLLRGNHEFDAISSSYGFKREILNFHNPVKMDKNTNAQKKIISEKNIFNFEEEEEEETASHEELCDKFFENHISLNCYKYTEELYNAFMKTFSYLPIAAIVNKTTFCIHGGLSPLLTKIERITKEIQRPIYNVDDSLLLTDLLWGDPSPTNPNFFSENPRGRGKLFNGISVFKFLKNNNMTRMIRAHECVNQGIREDFNGKCITVFSASSYNKNMGNLSGILKLSLNNDEVESIFFEPIHRIKKYDAVYFKVSQYNETKPSKSIFFSHYNLKTIPSSGCLPDHSSNDTMRIDLKLTASHGIPNTKSIRTNASNFRSGLLSNRITFITGAQNRKSIELATSPFKFQKDFSDHSTSKQASTISNQVRLPFLSAKNTI